MFIESSVIKIKNVLNNHLIVKIKFIIIKINVLIWIETHNKIYTMMKIRYENNFRDKIEYHINVFNV